MIVRAFITNEQHRKFLEGKPIGEIRVRIRNDENTQFLGNDGLWHPHLLNRFPQFGNILTELYLEDIDVELPAKNKEDYSTSFTHQNPPPSTKPPIQESTEMKEMEILKKWKQLCQRSEVLHRRAMSGELEVIVKELGGLQFEINDNDEDRYKDIHPAMRPDPYPRILLRAICRKVIPNDYDYCVGTLADGTLHIILLGYAQRHIGSWL